MSADDKPRLLSGGNPQIPKGDGDAPVQAYIAAMPGWKSAFGRRIDELIVQAVPDVQKAVKWNSPLYGMGNQTWFLGLHCFTRYVKVSFFKGAALDPYRPARPGRRRCAISTSTRTTPSTKRNSRTGSGRPARCPANGCRRRTVRAQRSGQFLEPGGRIELRPVAQLWPVGDDRRSLGPKLQQQRRDCVGFRMLQREPAQACAEIGNRRH